MIEWFIEWFSQAKTYLETVPYLARGYLILGGMDTGVVITRSYNWTDHEEVCFRLIFLFRGSRGKRRNSRDVRKREREIDYDSASL